MSNWQCTSCGLLNAPTVDKCIACFTHNTQIYLQCPECDFLNQPQSTKCIACFNEIGLKIKHDVDEWMDFEKNLLLKQYKQSLPLSIQRIIEFAQQLIGYNKVIDLDFNEIDNDLKYQYNLYNGDETTLKKLYFNYNPKSEYDI